MQAFGGKNSSDLVTIVVIKSQIKDGLKQTMDRSSALIT